MHAPLRSHQWGVVMSLTPERGRILAAYAQDRRGWDAPGSLAKLREVAHLDADEIALAWVRFCADPKAKTPGAFPNLSGPHWRERIKAGDLAPRHPRRAEACTVCGNTELHPYHVNDHEFTQRRHGEADAAAEVERLRGLIRTTTAATTKGDAS